MRRFCRNATGEIVMAMQDDQGRLVPDRRRVPFRAPEFVTTPAEFASRRPAPAPEPPFRIDKTLHFSNGGGVYLATGTRDHRQVVLKGARPLAAYDLAGRDAVARARIEYAALRRFAADPGIPAVYDQFTWQTHVFTVMEYIRGTTLQEWCATRNLLLLRGDSTREATQDELHGYRDEVESILEAVRGTLETIWNTGHVVGDIHPSNVMVTPESGVKLLDLEAFGSADEPRVLGGSPGSTYRGVGPSRSSRPAAAQR